MTTEPAAVQESPEQAADEPRGSRPGGRPRVGRGRAVHHRAAGRDRPRRQERLHHRSGRDPTCPMPLLLGAVHRALHGRVSRMTTLVALGTHQPMSEAALARHLGYPAGRLEETYPGMTVLNHAWWEPETFADLGTIPAARLEELSEGRLSMDVPVLLNRAVVEHDVALVLGPVLPHEVVGISGGNKYFFPGVAGQQIIDVSHWIGALITSAEIIGTTAITPVRA